MDMKKILQAMDGASTKPVEGTSDMSKFVSIVNEGANPHKVALPVQMAMNHYQKPAVKKQPKPSVIGKYFVEAEEAINQRKEEKRELINQYASTIAQRVLMKESALKDKEDLKAKRKALQDIQVDPHTHKDPELKTELMKRKAALEKEAKEKGLAESPIDMTGDPNDPTIYGHQGANPMSLKARIGRARGQLQELAQRAESNDLVVWQNLTSLFPELAMNMEQIKHGITELSAKRKKGGTQSRGIDKNI